MIMQVLMFLFLRIFVFVMWHVENNDVDASVTQSDRRKRSRELAPTISARRTGHIGLSIIRHVITCVRIAEKNICHPVLVNFDSRPWPLNLTYKGHGEPHRDRPLPHHHTGPIYCSSGTTKVIYNYFSQHVINAWN